MLFISWVQNNNKEKSCSASSGCPGWSFHSIVQQEDNVVFTSLWSRGQRSAQLVSLDPEDQTWIQDGPGGPGLLVMSVRSNVVQAQLWSVRTGFYHPGNKTVSFISGILLMTPIGQKGALFACNWQVDLHWVFHLSWKRRQRDILYIYYTYITNQCYSCIFLYFIAYILCLMLIVEYIIIIYILLM